MHEINEIAITRLKNAGNGLYPTLVTGGIYDRKLSKEEEGGTPAAFAPYPGDLAQIPRVRNSIVVFGPNDVDPPDGPIDNEDIVLRNGFLRLFYYFPATTDGKHDFDQMDRLVRAALNRYSQMLSIGFPVFFKPLDLVEPMDSDEWDYTKVAQRRILCEWMQPG